MAAPETLRIRLALPALFLGASLISFAPIFVRLSEIGPTATAFWRLTMALPVLALWMSWERRGTHSTRKPSSLQDYWRLGLAGLFFAADLGLWHWSINFTTVANATLFANFSPIFVTLAAYFLFRERFRPVFIIGLICAVAGAVTLMGTSLDLSRQHIIGDVLGLGTAVFYGAYLLAVGRLRADFSTATIMTWSGVVSSLVLLPVTWISGENLIAPTAYGWAILVGLALISQVGGQSLIAYAFAHLSAAFGAVSLMLQPVLSIFLAWIILSENLGTQQLVGAGIVLIGVFLANKGRV